MDEEEVRLRKLEAVHSKMRMVFRTSLWIIFFVFFGVFSVFATAANLPSRAYPLYLLIMVITAVGGLLFMAASWIKMSVVEYRMYPDGRQSKPQILQLEENIAPKVEELSEKLPPIRKPLKALMIGILVGVLSSFL